METAEGNFGAKHWAVFYEIVTCMLEKSIYRKEEMLFQYYP